jgi:hypothetical protein
MPRIIGIYNAFKKTKSVRDPQQNKSKKKKNSVALVR